MHAHENVDEQRVPNAPASDAAEDRGPSQDASGDDAPVQDAPTNASERSSADEGALAEARSQLAEARAQIVAMRGEMDKADVVRRLRDALEDAGAVRVREALRAAQEAMAGSMAPGAAATSGADGRSNSDAATGADAICRAIDAVRAAHPEFFVQARWGSTNAPASSTSTGDVQRASEVDRLAARARMANDRRALLEYLRARRAR